MTGKYTKNDRNKDDGAAIVLNGHGRHHRFFKSFSNRKN